MASKAETGYQAESRGQEETGEEGAPPLMGFIEWEINALLSDTLEPSS